MSAITDRFARARQMSRELWPTWSRRMRARWVRAKLMAPGPRVPIGSFSYDLTDFRFARRAS